jgi:3D (Asp-Asp-Asp) domain-containing protein
MNQRSSSVALLTLTGFLGFSLPPVVLAQPEQLCAIEPTSKISSINQSRCLLRPVRKGAKFEPSRSSLPETLASLMAMGSLSITRDQLRQYLQKRGIRESEIGGSLDAEVSRAYNNSDDAELARYFIIHDTSTPNLLTSPFPANIDQDSWQENHLSRWLEMKPLAHVFIGRTGKSITTVDFSTPWRTTGYEMDICKIPCKGLFLGVELVQPRTSDPAGPLGNDLIAPTNGFTDSQLERLAVVYVAASVRRGRWLIPAFHAVLDSGLKDGHDDPQNFDLARWDLQLSTVLSDINSSEGVRSDFSFPEPNTTSLKPRNLWATHYQVFPTAAQNQGIPLLDMDNKPISPNIPPRDWCMGGIEGTIQITDFNGTKKTYNYLDSNGAMQVNCRDLLRKDEPWIDATSRNRYYVTTGPFGDGVQGYQLVPFRTIAVDPAYIPYGSVVYIRSIRGQRFRTPNGQNAVHDGYFYAADKGGAIEENHIDIFIGLEQRNPFPSVILSAKAPAFEAFVIQDEGIRSALGKLHQKQQ